VDADRELMGRAVQVGERGRLDAPPNPWVGCVLVREGAVVGEGHHERPGAPHAEAVALAAAGDAARGATAYVTLEPCSHHGRTPPCADALLAAGVTRVVVGQVDPDPRVSGRGLARLREQGVTVDVLDDPDARRSLAPYLHQRSTGRAWCLAKVAMTLDGRIAARDGSSQWITGEDARADAHRLRAECQAVVVGSGTALADRPALTVRGVSRAPRVAPLRVLLDGRGRVPATGPLFDPVLGATTVLTTDGAPPERLDAWRAAGAKVDVLPGGPGGGVDLAEVLALLGREGVLQAMVEGGAHVLGALADGGLIDRLVAYVAPTLLGADALPAFAGAGPATLRAAPRLTLVGSRPVGDDLRLDLERTPLTAPRST